MKRKAKNEICPLCGALRKDHPPKMQASFKWPPPYCAGVLMAKAAVKQYQRDLDKIK